MGGNRLLMGGGKVCAKHKCGGLAAAFHSRGERRRAAGARAAHTGSVCLMRAIVASRWRCYSIRLEVVLGPRSARRLRPTSRFRTSNRLMESPRAVGFW